MGPGVANECIETKDGLTVWEDHFYPEVIDPETGRVLPDGERGELVWTSLTKQALPVIRYRSRDLTRLLAPTARAMRRMERITGRSDDMLIIRGVNVFPTQIEAILLQDDRVAPHYQLEVRRERTLDTLDVVVECAPAFAGSDTAARTDAAKAIQHHIKAMVGVSAGVRLVDPGQVARSMGKAVRIVDLRKKD
jgi:phenylacetate-CoA ligase